MVKTFFETERLVAREWQAADLEPFYLINSSEKVMEFFPNTMTREQSDTYTKELQKRIRDYGFGFWAVEEKASGQFIGFVGLNSPKVDLPFTPCIEIGWRLSDAFWGKGYATEAATASLDYAFSRLKTSEVFSFTATINQRSERVMKRLGMKNTCNNFMHPAVPETSKLCEHVLYCISYHSWQQQY